MLKLRSAQDRGTADYGWLKACYSFSFGEYQDPKWMRWRSLRVMNEDRIAGNTGFPAHPHREMEIITIVLKGSIAHQDSTGGEGVIQAGEIQVMSAGRGVVHSERNAEDSELHLYQIWLIPGTHGVNARYDQMAFDPKDRSGQWQLMVSNEESEKCLMIHQDARIMRRNFLPGDQDEITINSGRGHWLQVISGDISLESESEKHNLKSGDGVAIEAIEKYSIHSLAESDLLLFDLA